MKRINPWTTVETFFYEDCVIERTTPHGSAVSGVRVFNKAEWDKGYESVDGDRIGIGIAASPNRDRSKREGPDAEGDESSCDDSGC